MRAFGQAFHAQNSNLSATLFPLVTAAYHRGFSTGSSDKYRGLRPFKPGQSGNPNGRPKKALITKMFEQMLNKPGKRKKVQAVVEDILEKRGMAAVLLLREMIERTEGKVSQEVELSGSLLTLSDEDLALKLAKLLGK